MPVSRRSFLTYVGLGTVGMLRGPVSAAGAKPRPAIGRAPKFFDPISPSGTDQLLLPRGYTYDLIASWQDPLGSKEPGGKGAEETFGFNNDFLAYFPLGVLTGEHDRTRGLLWVNHEYPDGLYVSGYTPADRDAKKLKTLEQIQIEKRAVGGSILYLERGENGAWKTVHHPTYTRRFTSFYPRMEATGPAARALLDGDGCFGTLGNCSGGKTPWHTVLTCEENYPDYNPNYTSKKGYGHCWGDVPGQEIDERKYGWIVEVDPFGILPPTKHTSLGHFAHENAAMRYDGPKKKMVVYMGDDANDQYLYKFVSAASYDEKASRRDQSQLLAHGMLYVADFSRCVWQPLDIERNVKILSQAGFTDQQDVLLRSREASKALGATPLDRPEDCEVHPKDGSLYVALSNNLPRGEQYGKILRLIEDDDNPEAESFVYEIFLTGGPNTGLACPDNLAFDKDCNLWVACDMSTSKMGKKPYEPFGNNGLFVVPTSGGSSGDAYQFASAPIGAELTGPWFNDEGDTLFLAIQHPGEDSPSLEEPKSRWPRKHGPSDLPRPSVVAIRGFR